MINFDSLSLKALVDELKPVLTAGRVHKVQQPSKNILLISIRASGKNHKLYICADPKYPHLALLSDFLANKFRPFHYNSRLLLHLMYFYFLIIG